jgi:hypothetical protein
VARSLQPRFPCLASRVQQLEVPQDLQDCNIFTCHSTSPFCLIDRDTHSQPNSWFGFVAFVRQTTLSRVLPFVMLWQQTRFTHEPGSKTFVLKPFKDAVGVNACDLPYLCRIASIFKNTAPITSVIVISYGNYPLISCERFCPLRNGLIQGFDSQ